MYLQNPWVTLEPVGHSLLEGGRPVGHSLLEGDRPVDHSLEQESSRQTRAST